MTARIVPISGDLQIALLASPYDTLSNPTARDLFSQTAALKIQGYRAVYPYGVLPVDTYDFIATHHLVCRSTPQGFKVIMGYKSVTLERCQTHRLPFPGISLLRSSGARAHEQALEELLQRYSTTPDRVTYGSSWTIAREVRENPVLKHLLKNLMTAMLVSHEEEIGSVTRISCGVPKVKTDRYFESLGYQRLTHQGKPLVPFEQSSLIDERAVLLHCSHFTDDARTTAQRYRSLWDQRIHIDVTETDVAAKEAA